MKEKENFLTIVHLYVEDSLFNIKALITPERMRYICNNKIANVTKFEHLDAKWHLKIVKLKDDYIDLYQKQGNRPIQFYEKHLLFVLDLVRDGECFKALYVMHSGMIVIFPSEYLEVETKNYYFEKMIVEKDASINRKKIRERCYVGLFNCLLFIKDKKSFYLIKDKEETLQYVKCSYML